MKLTPAELNIVRSMEGKLHELALFSGTGGGVLASHLLGIQTVAAVEIDEYARRTLIERQADSGLGQFPVFTDCRSFDGRSFRGLVDVVSAGFPCQPFAVAGKKRASADERNGWPETIRIIREVRPAICLLENVPGLLSCRHNYYATVLEDLAKAGFDAEWGVLSAAAVGARHKRERLWLLAYSVRDGAREVLRNLSGQAGEASIGARRRMWAQPGNGSEEAPDSDSQRFSRRA